VFVKNYQEAYENELAEYVRKIRNGELSSYRAAIEKIKQGRPVTSALSRGKMIKSSSPNGFFVSTVVYGAVLIVSQIYFLLHRSGVSL